jgi:predicted glycoside hydrolase/deacetylase ChbG (UPF0249 family)
LSSARHRLIVNADDYGFTPGVNEGIAKCLRAGVVRSISCLANFDLLDDLGRLVAEHPHLSVGVHFNLSHGPPVSDPRAVPSLIGDNGMFLGAGTARALVTRAARPDEVQRELTAQVERLARPGVTLTHWDGHQNLNLFPGFFGAAQRVARRFGIERMRTHRRALYGETGPLPLEAVLRYYVRNPVRMLTHGAARIRMLRARHHRFRMADSLITPGYVDATEKSWREFWWKLPAQLPPGTHELYCHPALPDDALRGHTAYVESRYREAEVLSDPSLVDAFLAHDVELVSFHDL